MDLCSFLVCGFTGSILLLLSVAVVAPRVLEWKANRKKSEAYRLARAHLVRSRTRR